MPAEFAELKTELTALELVRINDYEVLSDWEYDFIESMHIKLEKNSSFTLDQVQKIEELYDRFEEEGLL